MQAFYWMLMSENGMSEILAESMAYGVRRNEILAKTNEDPR